MSLIRTSNKLIAATKAKGAGLGAFAMPSDRQGMVNAMQGLNQLLTIALAVKALEESFNADMPTSFFFAQLYLLRDSLAQWMLVRRNGFILDACREINEALSDLMIAIKDCE